MPQTAKPIAWMTALLLGLTAGAVLADEDADLAAKIANPAANRISVPFQDHHDCGLGQDDAGRHTLGARLTATFLLRE